ncbi:uncharacterized protein [Cicer arietinum]|uniref:uncharacterized protein n=1 Tax=Cicer arietinum TaxID=3827 RepID=UPI003CC6C2CD
MSIANSRSSSNSSDSEPQNDTTSFPEKDPALNPRNPYYLHPSENPSAVLFAPPLNNNNYHNWSKAMKRALSSKNKIQFINGSLPLPASTHPDFELWDRANNMVISWITRTLSSHISQSTICIDTAYDLWCDLRERFTNGNHFWISDLLRDLHSIKQGDRNLSTFFTNLKILWDELEDLRPTPSCVCSPTFKCNLSTTVNTFKQHEYVTCFLKGLNDNYANVRTQILLMDPLPSISKVYSMVVQQEPNTNPTTPDNTVFHFNSGNPSFGGQGPPQHARGRGRGQSKNQVFCTNCHKTNHTVETCYFKHGFPPGYRSHKPPTSNSDSANNNKTVHSAISTPDDSSTQLSKEDFKLLINLLHSSKQDSMHDNQKSANDSTNRASDHVCPFIQCFSTIERIKPVYLTFPNGNHIFAHFSGSIIFDESLSLHNDSHTQKMIGLVEHHNNLYVLKKSPVLSYDESVLPSDSISCNKHEHIFPYPSIDSINEHCIPNDVTDFTTLLFDDPIYIVDNIDHVSNIPHNAHFDNHTNIINDSTNSPAPPLRRSSRTRQKPAYLQDFQCNIVVADHSSNPLYPISSVLTYNNLSLAHFSFIYVISYVQEPNTYKQAVKHSCWVQAMDSEIQALTQNSTWILTPLPHGKKPIGCRWVYKVKYKADGTIERYKARLVAKGFTQVEGIDFFDTYSPVAKLTTVRLLLSIASSQNWHIHQLDVHNAFLHGNLEEEVYMQLPPGISTTNPTHVCKLLKSLYGLKQSSRQWFAKFSTALCSIGYSESASNHSLFTKSSTNKFTALLIYVDDVIVSGNDIAEIHFIKDFLNKTFKIKDLGYLKYFLGLEVARSKAGLHISQRKYTLDILHEAGLLASKPAFVPM